MVACGAAGVGKAGTFQCNNIRSFNESGVRTSRRRMSARARWRSGGVRCGRLSTSRSRCADLRGRVRRCRREEGRLHCATLNPKKGMKRRSRGRVFSMQADKVERQLRGSKRVHASGGGSRNAFVYTIGP